MVCLQPTAYAIPKRKMRDKLAVDGRVKEIVLGEDHDEQVVTGTILKLLPNLLSKDNSPPFRYMHASSSGEIICAELQKVTVAGMVTQNVALLKAVMPTSSWPPLTFLDRTRLLALPNPLLLSLLLGRCR